MNGEFGVQISEYKKLLDVRASRIQKLEMAVREAAYSQVQTFSSAVRVSWDSRDVILARECSKAETT